MASGMEALYFLTISDFARGIWQLDSKLGEEAKLAVNSEKEP